MTQIIAGLGNPGKKYIDTRHNVGRMVLERFCEAHDLSSWEDRKEIKARMSRGMFGKREVVLLEPDDYMNNSGKSIAKYVKNESLYDLIIIHDDIDLPIGTFRISYNKGSGGHNGVRSVESELKTKQFARVRIGIAPRTFFGIMRKPKGKGAVQNFVLNTFSRSESQKLESVLEKAVKAIDSIMQDGVTKAMNEWNGR